MKAKKKRAAATERDLCPHCERTMEQRRSIILPVDSRGIPTSQYVCVDCWRASFQDED
jgi:hypothetical protein